MSKSAYQIKILPEEQLMKMSTPRLVNIHRKLTAYDGHLRHLVNPDEGFPDSVALKAQKELDALKEFSDALYRILATREHVKRKK
jgi:hypothetical protein